MRKAVPLKEGQDVLVRAEGERIVIEPLPENPYEILARVIGQPYNERRDEPRADKWLKRHAGH